MQLIDSLASGLQGAANGTASLYKRGTATRATWYADFFGTSAVATGADITLDANGGAVVYVNELVDVQVVTAQGVVLRTFTAGSDATAINYSGLSFKGTDPVTGQTATNQPILLKRLLDLFVDSFGATDALVASDGIGSTSRKLYEILQGLFCFYNVKDPLYGATGDGSTDDTSAIQACLDACDGFGGGIVYFPHGNYILSAALVKASNTSMLGGGTAKLIQTTGGPDTVGATTLDCSSGAQLTFVRGLDMGANTSDGSPMVTYGNSNVSFERCRFGDGVNQGGWLVLNSAAGDGSQPGTITFTDCEFYPSGANSAIGCSAAALNIVVRGGKITAPTTAGPAYYIVALGYLEAEGVFFKLAGLTAGGTFCIQAFDARVTNCTFSPPSAGTSYAFDVQTSLYEANNTFSSGLIPYNTPSETVLKNGRNRWQSRENRFITYSTSTTPLTIDALNYGDIKVYATVASSAVIKITPAPRGATLRLTVVNLDGSNRAFTIETIGTDTNLYLIDASQPVTINTVTHKGYMLASQQVATGTDITQWASVVS